MPSRRVKKPWILLERVNHNPPARAECCAADWRCAGGTDAPETTVKSEWDDFSPEEMAPADQNDDGRWFPAPSSHVDLRPSPRVPFSTPASLWSPPHRAPWTRSSQRRARRAVASHPYKARGCRRFRAPASRRPRCGGCHSCGRRRCRPWRCRPRACKPKPTSWEHLPAVIPPTKWYQVVGSMQCYHCRDQGRHQMTSWMCQSCRVPLCLMPFRNCYAKWHGSRC